MKSKELREIKKCKIEKKVLLINPKREDTLFQPPHNGLAILAAILKKRGHKVFVIDYAFIQEQRRDVSFFIKDFNPDVIGISVYTPNANEADIVISKVHEINSEIPIIMGGPHATLYSELLQKDKRIDYIFLGEAELTIIDVVEKAKKEKNPKIIESKEIVDLNDIPFPDYKTFYNWKSMLSYPIMTSRGCPYHCSFCASFGLSNKRWRERKVEDCINELEIAKKTISPHLTIVVLDDCPTVDKKRFYEFLDLFSKKIDLRLYVGNTRADQIDEKFLTLLKKCKCKGIAIGVEHAHPEVFKLVNKGETLKQIWDACKLIKKHKMELALTFIIGLPKDTLQRTKESIKFCRKAKADMHSINLLLPFRHTAARKWFEENGAKLYNEIGREAQIPTQFECDEIVVETDDFSSEDRKKAYYMFLFGVAHRRLRLRDLKRIFAIAKKYNLYSDFFDWLPRGILKSLQIKISIFKSGIKHVMNGELGLLLKKYNSNRLQNKIHVKISAQKAFGEENSE